MIRTQGLTHIHLLVRDLERSLRFYTGVFGMEERFRDGAKMVFLNTPGSQDLITLNEDPVAARLAGVNGGVAHFGFRLAKSADLDAAVREVEAAGGKLIRRGEHGPGVRFAYIEIPTDTSLSCELDERGQKTAVVIDSRRHAGVRDDFFGVAVAKSRQDEPRTLLRMRT